MHIQGYFALQLINGMILLHYGNVLFAGHKRRHMRYKRGMQGTELEAYREYRRNLYKRNVEAAGFEYKPGRQQTMLKTVYPTFGIDTISDRRTARAKQLGIKREDYVGSAQEQQDYNWIMTGHASDVHPVTSPTIIAPITDMPPNVDSVRAMLQQLALEEEITGVTPSLFAQAVNAHEPLVVLPTRTPVEIVTQMFAGVTLDTFRVIATESANKPSES